MEDVCPSLPCRNNGTCLGRPGSYVCECVKPWTGTNCTLCEDRYGLREGQCGKMSVCPSNSFIPSFIHPSIHLSIHLSIYLSIQYPVVIIVYYVLSMLENVHNVIMVIVLEMMHNVFQTIYQHQY